METLRRQSHKRIARNTIHVPKNKNSPIASNKVGRETLQKQHSTIFITNNTVHTANVTGINFFIVFYRKIGAKKIVDEFHLKKM